MKAIEVTRELLIFGATLLYSLFLLHYLFPTLYHRLMDNLLALWEAAKALRDRAKWTEEWQGLWDSEP